MTALAADAQREKRGVGRIFAFPVKTGVTIYKGALVTIEAATGFAIPATDTASAVCVGVAVEKVAAGAAASGTYKIRVFADCEFLFTASSIAQTMVGVAMCVVDDNTVDDAAGPTNDVPVGKLTEYISATQGWVYVPGITQ